MSANNAKVQSLIESVLNQTIEKLNNDKDGAFVCDLYIQVDKSSGELLIFDDMEREIEKIVIYDWLNSKQEESLFIKNVTISIKSVLSSMASKGCFEGMKFVKPLSISMTDEEFNITEELIFLDDDMLRVDDHLLKDLDKDLDDFLKNLLSDMK